MRVPTSAAASASADDTDVMSHSCASSAHLRPRVNRQREQHMFRCSTRVRRFSAWLILEIICWMPHKCYGDVAIVRTTCNSAVTDKKARCRTYGIFSCQRCCNTHPRPSAS